jgi:hypothetical protein
VKLRRLAIRAAKFEPEADYATWTVSEIHSDGILVVEKKRGAIKGPIRIPLHSQLFLFSALAFPCIPSKSLKFRPVVFSIPIAPTKSPFESVAFASREPKIGAQKALVLAPSWPQISARICRAITS